MIQDKILKPSIRDEKRGLRGPPKRFSYRRNFNQGENVVEIEIFIEVSLVVVSEIVKVIYSNSYLLILNRVNKAAICIVTKILS